MKKTLTINLGGIVFHIDEDAFEVLNSYLNTIRGYFDSSEGRDEIMGDIESRIAEMLQEKISGAKQVINSTDINEVIGVMGQPEDYLDEEMGEESTHHYQQSQQGQTHQKRLYRDTDGATIGGVCSGLGYYTGVDPIWFKLAFVAMVFLGLSGILIYIILWIIMPEARTTAEKLAMKGHPITFDNIGKSVEDSINNVKKKLNNLDGNNRDRSQRVNETIRKVVSALGTLLMGVFKALAKIIGVLFVLSSFIGLVALLFGSMLPVNNLMFTVNDIPAGFHFNEFSHLIYASKLDYVVSVVGWWLMAGIPLVALMAVGFYLTAKIKIPRYAGIALAAGFVLGILLFTFGGLKTGLDFAAEKTVPQRVIIDTAQDTLYLNIFDPEEVITSSTVNLDYFIEFGEEGVLLGDIKIDVLPSKKTVAELEIIKMSRGGTNADATERAENIVYEIAIDSNKINLSPYLFVLKEDKFRNQQVRVNLRLPEGKTVYIASEYKYLLDDVANYHNTWDQYMVKKYWTMTDSGLITPNTDYTESVDYINGNQSEQLEIQLEKSMKLLEKEIEENLEENLNNVEIKISEYEEEQNIRKE